MEILQEIISYGTVIFLVTMVTRKLRTSENVLDVIKGGEYCIDMKQYSKVFRIIGILFIVLFLCVSLFPSNVTGKTKLLVLAIEVAIVGGCYLASYLYSRFYVRIGNERIAVRDIVGKEKIIYYCDLTDVLIDGQGNIELYSENSKVLVFPNSFDQTFLLENLKKNKIKVKHKVSMKEFVLEPTKLERVASYICLIAIIALDILSIAVGHWGGILFFTSFAIFIICLCISMSKDKVIISNHTITRKRFLRNTKTINFSDIKYVKITDDENAKIYLYSEKGLEMKFPKNMKNVNMFEELIKRQRWKVQK